jgi:hypothetical protein
MKVRPPERRHAAAGSHAARDSAAASSAATSRRVRTASWAARAEAMARGLDDAEKRSSGSSVQRRRQQLARTTLVRPAAAASSRRSRMRSRTSLGSVLRRSTPPAPSSGLAVGGELAAAAQPLLHWEKELEASQARGSQHQPRQLHLLGAQQLSHLLHRQARYQ